jgi:hypothetical protein
MVKKILSLLLLLSLSMCATINLVQEEKNVMGIIEVINSGNSEKLIECSRVPFLLDGEIIMMEQDITMLWTNLMSGGFTIEEAVVTHIQKIDKAAYKEFENNMEIEAYFQKYLPGKAVLSRVSTKDGDYLFLTGKGKKGTTLLYGLKGPEL